VPAGRPAPRVGIVLLIGALLGGALLYYTLTHRRPLIPADADHLQAQTQERCLECHAPGKPHARGRNHPLNDQCFNCHERA
jgi:hypothetical protein